MRTRHSAPGCHGFSGVVESRAVKPISTSTFTFRTLRDGGAALAQIREKRYHERYLGSGLRVVLVGTGFSLKTRNLVRPKIEEASGKEPRHGA